MIGWLIAGVALVLGALCVAASFVPDDAMVAVPLPEGAARRWLRPLGIGIMLLGLAAPPAMTQLDPLPPAPTPTPTEVQAGAATAVPTIPVIPTATPIPPTPTPRPTRGTPAPSQFI